MSALSAQVGSGRMNRQVLVKFDVFACFMAGSGIAVSASEKLQHEESDQLLALVSPLSHVISCCWSGCW